MLEIDVGKAKVTIITKKIITTGKIYSLKVFINKFRIVAQIDRNHVQIHTKIT